MRGLAIIGGEGPPPELLRKIAGGADLLAAADSGLIAAEEAGLRPHWLIGDMDSLEELSGDGPGGEGLGRLDKYPQERVLRFPPDKDFTDTELAFNLLREKGCGEILIAGGGGGRTDHLFGIRSLFEREDPPLTWFTEKEEIRCLMPGASYSKTLPGGSLVSVFPLGTGPWEAESEGLKWPLGGFPWKRESAALSNITLDGTFRVSSRQGKFMIIMPLYFGEKDPLIFN